MSVTPDDLMKLGKKNVSIVMSNLDLKVDNWLTKSPILGAKAKDSAKEDYPEAGKEWRSLS